MKKVVILATGTEDREEADDLEKAIIKEIRQDGRKQAEGKKNRKTHESKNKLKS